MLVEEDPQAELADAVKSVFRATAASLPWLRLHVRPPASPPRHHAPVEADLPEGNHVDFERNDRPADDPWRWLRKDDGPGASPMDLLREVLGAVRDFIAHPLTWIVGVPLLLVCFMFAVLRTQRR